MSGGDRVYYNAEARPISNYGSQVSDADKKLLDAAKGGIGPYAPYSANNPAGYRGTPPAVVSQAQTAQNLDNQGLQRFESPGVNSAGARYVARSGVDHPDFSSMPGGGAWYNRMQDRNVFSQDGQFQRHEGGTFSPPSSSSPPGGGGGGKNTPPPSQPGDGGGVRPAPPRPGSGTPSQPENVPPGTQPPPPGWRPPPPPAAGGDSGVTNLGGRGILTSQSPFNFGSASPLQQGGDVPMGQFIPLGGSGSGGAMTGPPSDATTQLRLPPGFGSGGFMPPQMPAGAFPPSSGTARGFSPQPGGIVPQMSQGGMLPAPQQPPVRSPQAAPAPAYKQQMIADLLRGGGY